MFLSPNFFLDFLKIYYKMESEKMLDVGDEEKQTARILN
jgi:hypothetical protein